MTSLTSASYAPPVAHAVALEDRTSWRAALVFAALILLGFGFLYSLAGAAAGRLLFPHQATGSIVVVDGLERGSALVAQPFDDARYFQPRPSAANYDPMAAAGSNLARSNPDLRKRIDELTQAVAQREGITPAQVPGELVTQSGGGLDPHLSPQGHVIHALGSDGVKQHGLAGDVAGHMAPGPEGRYVYTARGVFTSEGKAVGKLGSYSDGSRYCLPAAEGEAFYLRIDVPGPDGNLATQFYAPNALYCLTPVTEDMARRVARYNAPAPVTRWELLAASTLEAKRQPRGDEWDDELVDEEPDGEEATDVG